LYLYCVLLKSIHRAEIGDFWQGPGLWLLRSVVSDLWLGVHLYVFLAQMFWKLFAVIIVWWESRHLSWFQGNVIDFQNGRNQSKTSLNYSFFLDIKRKKFWFCPPHIVAAICLLVLFWVEGVIYLNMYYSYFLQ
jgi:hypothetical protein